MKLTFNGAAHEVTGSCHCLEACNKKIIVDCDAEPVVPVYTIEDAENVLTYFVPCEYEKKIDIAPGIQIRMRDVGHLLGSASIEVWLTEAGHTKKIVFSGDIGNTNQPLIKDPLYVDDAD